MYSDVYAKIQRKNKLLFNRDSLALAELLSDIRQASRKDLILWALNNSMRILENLESKSNYDQTLKAIKTAEAWAFNQIKMPVAKAEILNLHKLSKTTKALTEPYYLQAIAQGLSTIHVETHAIGLAIYELSGIVVKNNYQDFEVNVSETITGYINDLKKIKASDKSTYNWSKFIIDMPENKELLLYKKNLNIDK